MQRRLHGGSVLAAGRQGNLFGGGPLTGGVFGAGAAASCGSAPGCGCCAVVAVGVAGGGGGGGNFERLAAVARRGGGAGNAGGSNGANGGNSTATMPATAGDKNVAASTMAMKAACASSLGAQGSRPWLVITAAVG